MAKRRPKYPITKPWKPDPDKWKRFLPSLQLAPKGGWRLWDWRTLRDVKQR